MINLIKIFFAVILIYYSLDCIALDLNNRKHQNQITIEADELIYNKKEDFYYSNVSNLCLQKLKPIL